MRQGKLSITFAVIALPLLAACSSVSYVTGEMSGGVKPVGGIAESIPVTRSYPQAPDAVRQAVLGLLMDQGYITTASPSPNEIRTEPKVMPGSGSSMMVEFSSRLFVTLEGSTVGYRVRFDKKSSVVQPETGLTFVEKENELRRDFFAALDKKLPR